MNPDFQTPLWVHQAIFYQIFPDRFARSDFAPNAKNVEAWYDPPTFNGFKGGDLMGIYEKLDYLNDLGINAIYLNPIFQSASNHRYHTHDYYQVDPLLGGNKLFRKLLDEAHRRNIRIILDGVFNHASRGFFQFNHILEMGKDSPFLNWFRVHNLPLNAYQGKPNYDCWMNIPALPEFNFEHHEVRSFILDVASYWLQEGIDGWRLDVPFCVNDELFWIEFRETVKNINPDAYIVGEIPDDATRWLDGEQFDGVMNYPWAYSCWGFFGGAEFDKKSIGHWLTHAAGYLHQDSKWFSSQVEELLHYHPKPAVMAQLNMLDSHDTPRFLTLMNGKKSLFRLAILFQMTYPGAPCIYYGDEIGMQGSFDPDCRRAFPWDETMWDAELWEFYKKCILLRKSHPCTSGGEYIHVFSKDGLYLYLRRLDHDVVLIVLNRSPHTIHLDIPIDSSVFKDESIFINQIASGQMSVKDSHLTGLTIAPETGAFLLKQ